jgi:hypothetical protein
MRSPRFERADVVGDVLAERAGAGTAGRLPRSRKGAFGRAVALGHRQPLDRTSHSTNAPTASGATRRLPKTRRNPWAGGTGSTTTAGCWSGLAKRLERHVARLARRRPVHPRREAVFTMLWISGTSGSSWSVDSAAPGSGLALHRLVERDVGATEAVDRLLGVADEEELSGRGRAGASLCPDRGGGRRLDLDRVGVLELVDEEVREALRALSGQSDRGSAPAGGGRGNRDSRPTASGSRTREDVAQLLPGGGARSARNRARELGRAAARPAARQLRLRKVGLVPV